MNKISGILALLVAICLGTALLNNAFVSTFNMENGLRWSTLFGIIGIGVAFVIITGGIDLSIGSMIGLTGCLLPMLLVDSGWPVPLALLTVMLLAIGLGLVHGLLITKLNLQPFIVTLCGLLIYRGLARTITGDQAKGFGSAYDDSLRLLAIGKPCSVASLFLLAGLLLLARAAWRCWRQVEAHPCRHTGHAAPHRRPVDRCHADHGGILQILVGMGGRARLTAGLDRFA